MDNKTYGDLFTRAMLNVKKIDELIQLCVETNHSNIKQILKDYEELKSNLNIILKDLDEIAELTKDN